MDCGESRLHEMQAKSRRLRAELEVLNAQIQAQVAQNERERLRNAAAAESDGEKEAA
jgi:hypothetical protein